VAEGEVVRFPIAQAEPLRLELQAFVEAVRGEHEIEVDGDAGLRALHLALALVTSASESKMIDTEGLTHLWAQRGLSGRTAAGGSRRQDI
jgi:predicted dehydrogenase